MLLMRFKRFFQTILLIKSIINSISQPFFSYAHKSVSCLLKNLRMYIGLPESYIRSFAICDESRKFAKYIYYIEEYIIT